MAEPYVALQSVMMPSDTNPYGTIFGGVILSNLDMAGAIAAAREVRLAGGEPNLSYVTVALNRVEFKQPVFVGDVVRYETTVTKWGRTSITLQVNVISDRLGEQIRVTEAEIVYVGINKERQPVPLLPTKTANS
ncbi:acyl-CoA thioesterase [Zavarzinella formosa]|uniref:acyl-CoA thioesterase n=1 Tax=Zavarzinella formosa TaxID=360055 RepID=UPI0002F79748|nr:hotdog domain-containing protein [Zavarzinella formosa]